MRAELPLTMSTVSPTPGVDRVDGDEIVAFRVSVRIHAAGHEQLGALEPRVLPRGNHRPDDLGEEHGA